jgi:DNA polymerase II large subunit
MAQGYCVKDKEKVEMVDPKPITLKNGRAALSGTCPKCGGKIMRIGG